MSDLPQALASIDSAPSGPRVGAFFDLDGTVVKGYAGLAFLRDDLEALGGAALLELANDLRSLSGHEHSDQKTIERAAQLLAGRPLADLVDITERMFKKRIAAMMRPDTRELVRAHRRRGHTVVLATAATEPQAAPLARDLDIPHLLATRVEVVHGLLTGRLIGPPCWGPDKARAAATFAADRGVDVEQSFAYANGREDRPLLELVGHPAAVCPDAELAQVAQSTGMTVLQLDDPAPATLRGVVGTLASLGTFNAGLIAAVTGSLVTGGRWKAIGPSLASAAELSLRIAGVEVRAQGKEHLESARPAVFVVNHQSNLDPVVAGTLIRHDFTAVGKQELANDPRALAMGWLDVALIDRSDSESARASVQALVERIQGGESVVIWPEGTRMPTPRLGPFKKGAFHLAIDAGVPIVPIVLRNTGELLPRGQMVLRAGVVDACVLPPIPTAGWTKERLPALVELVRGQFEATLADWPTPTSP